MERIFSFNRELGSLSTRVDGLERRLEERLQSQSKELESLRKDVRESNKKLDSLLRIVDGSRFTWRTFTFVGSGVAALFAALVWVANNIGPFFR